MQFDIYMVIGVIVLGFSIPSVVSAYSEGRAPRIAAIMVLIGGGLVALAVTQKPGGYTLEDVPAAFVRVIGQYVH